MQRGPRVCLLVLLATLSVLFAGCESSLAPQPQSLLTTHVRDVTLNGQAKPVGVLPADQMMRIDVVLPLRNESDLQRFIQEVNDPTHPSYHRFLAPEDFSAKYGPSQHDWDALVAFAEARGFQVTGGSRGARDLHLQGTVAIIEQAFNLTLRVYQHPTENRTFYAPDREPTAALPFPLLHISGLDNYSIPHPLFHKRTASDPIPHATTGSGPSASYLGSDMRAAYYGGSLTGTGQNVALLEYHGTDLADLSTYYANAHQTQPLTPTLISTDGTSTSCVSPGCDDTEQTLDMTQALGMAPGLSGLYVYVGSTDTAMISAMTTTADAPLSRQIGCSWGWTPADPSAVDGYWETMAAQGQNFFVASGDNSTWKKTGKAAAWPADAAYVVSVGGTDLTTTGAGGAWSSETAWEDSGGGPSPDSISIPSWQTSAASTCNTAGLGCSTTLRNGPDVAANANWTFYVCADQTTCTANDYGGTSFAAPMWAAYLALANEQAATNGDTIGFLDPLLYPAAEGSGYASLFHDVTSGTSGSYHAGTGFDLVTGWGSPNGSGLITLLAPLANGMGCLQNSDCASGYCYPGPQGGSYCIAATANCAQPGTNGVAFGTTYVYPATTQGVTYDCVAGSGLEAPPFADGLPCNHDGDCSSGDCSGGPGGQNFCMDTAENCVKPGTAGVLFGATYSYQGVTYDCISGSGLAPPPFLDGEPCNVPSDCSSTYCYPGPAGQSYCLAATSNCAQPGTGGVLFGASYSFGGVTYNCREGIGLSTAPFLANGAACSYPSDCSSGYCYPGPAGQSYCLAATSNCAQPGTDGVLFGASYSFGGVTYDCREGIGLSTAPFLANGAACSYPSDCSSGYCYPGPAGQSYCLAATSNCAQPGTDGVLFGASYSFGGVTYDCREGIGLSTAPFLADGAACSYPSDCSSTYCYPGPAGQSYCLAATSNCAQPGTAGVGFGQSYTYGGVTYTCTAGVGLVAEGTDAGTGD